MSASQATTIAAKLAKLVVPDAEAQARRERSERGEASSRAIELWGRAGVPARHADRALHPQPGSMSGPWWKVHEQVIGMLGRGVTVCLTGVRGNGKTQIAVDAILTMTMTGRAARFITAQRLFMEMKGSFDAGSRLSEAQVMDSFRRPKLLVIDEIGQRAETEWENRTFFELLNARYGDMTDTILTANLEPDKLASSLGSSLISRMSEGGGIIQCPWPSFR